MVCFVFLQTDLVSTVGESAALGASGVVMWGGVKDYNSEVTTAFCSLITGWTGLLPVIKGHSFRVYFSTFSVFFADTSLLKQRETGNHHTDLKTCHF